MPAPPLPDSRTRLRWFLGAAFLAQCAALYLPLSGGGGRIPGADKVVHLLLFAVVAWPAVRLGWRRRWVVPALTVQAVSSELVQHFLVAGRAGDPWDLVADLCGIALGVLTAGLPRPGPRTRPGSP